MSFYCIVESAIITAQAKVSYSMLSSHFKQKLSHLPFCVHVLAKAWHFQIKELNKNFFCFWKMQAIPVQGFLQELIFRHVCGASQLCKASILFHEFHTSDGTLQEMSSFRKRTQPIRHVPGTFLEIRLKVQTSCISWEHSGTFRGATRLLQVFYTSITDFYWTNKYSKDLNREAHETSMGTSCEMSWLQMMGRSGDVRGASVIHVF